MTIGFDEKILTEKIRGLIKTVNEKNIKKLYVIGILNHTSAQKRYFDKFLKNLPKDAYAIALSTYTTAANAYQVNSNYDFMLIYKILEEFAAKAKGIELKKTIYLTKCDKYAITNMLNLKNLGADEVFLAQCSPMIVNPGILGAFEDEFGIKVLRT